MKYEKIKKGFFVERPNRFIAIVDIDGKEEVCHVKNTGRCKELLCKGAELIVEDCSANDKRKTKYDVIAVKKGNRWINMDSQAPNKVVAEYLPKWLENIVLVKAETKYKNSRFDFYVETKQEKIFIEVKGVTLEENGVARFPDAPTERGIKHITELMDAVQDGYQAYIIFVIQMDGISYFEPNWETHREFGEKLQKAKRAGVNIHCVDCRVLKDELHVSQTVPYRL